MKDLGPRVECYYNTTKTCVNSPTKYCQHRGNLVECIRTKTCVVPKEIIDDKD